jgi:ElaB/YqjD/DUF883 family membrane-anchored ribosome-binding protein
VNASLPAAIARQTWLSALLSIRQAATLKAFRLIYQSRIAMSQLTDTNNVSKEKLVADLKVVVSDAEELLRATASAAGEKAGELREKMQDRLRDAKLRLADAEAALIDKTKAAARATDDFVHDHPWKAVGIAAGAGLLVGMLIGRR